MKRIGIILLSAVLLLGTAACTNLQPVVDAANDAAAPENVEIAKVVDTKVVDKILGDLLK